MPEKQAEGTMGTEALELEGIELWEKGKEARTG